LAFRFSVVFLSPSLRPASRSLDQGDLCRVLRRTMEVLRSLCLSPSLGPGLRDKARRAMDRLDRAPVTDDSYLTLQPTAAADAGAAGSDDEEEGGEEEAGEQGEEKEEFEEYDLDGTAAVE